MSLPENVIRFSLPPGVYENGTTLRIVRRPQIVFRGHTFADIHEKDTPIVRFPSDVWIVRDVRVGVLSILASPGKFPVRMLFAPGTAPLRVPVAFPGMDISIELECIQSYEDGIARHLYLTGDVVDEKMPPPRTSQVCPHCGQSHD